MLELRRESDYKRFFILLEFLLTKLFARNLARGKFYVAFRSGKIFCAQFGTPRCHKFVREVLRRATTFVFPSFWGMGKKFAKRLLFLRSLDILGCAYVFAELFATLVLGVTEFSLFSQLRGMYEIFRELSARLRGAIQQRKRASKAQFNNGGAPQRRNLTTEARLKGVI